MPANSFTRRTCKKLCNPSRLFQESGFSYPGANETDGVGGFGCERRGPRCQQVIGRDNLNLDLLIAAHEAMGIETRFQKIRANEVIEIVAVCCGA